MEYARPHIKQVIDLDWLFLILKIPGKCFTYLKNGISGLVKCMKRSGDVNDVVFPCGWGVVDNEIRIYYGSGDVLVSMASAKMSDIMEYIHKCLETQCLNGII